MKKLLIVLLATAMLFTVGCSGKNEANVMNEEVATDEQTAETINPVEELGLDYTTGLADNGFYLNVKASDYVEMVEYNNILIPSDVHMISEETVQYNIDGILADFAKMAEVMDRAVVDGDTVNIDYVGSVDGVEFDGGSTGGNGTEVTIGVTSYIDDFLAQLIGHLPGESFDIEVTFPEDYSSEELSGKDVVFTITINSISETISPDLTDEFVSENLAENYNSTTVLEFRTFIQSELKTNAVEGFVQNYIITNFVVSSVPEDVLNYQKKIMENDYRVSAVQYNVTLEEFLTNYVGYETLEEVLEASVEQIDLTSQITLIIQAIAEDADISVTDDKLKNYFIKYTDSEDYSQFEKIYGISYLKNSILQNIVLDYLVSNATLEQ